jgi:uncharacterized protein
MDMLSFIVLGLCAGTFSGLVGIGGGIIIVPALVYLFGLSQHLAQGTTLAIMVPPIGLLAAWAYYKEGYVDFKIALLVAVGFLAGSYCGSHLALMCSNKTLSRIFGIFITFVGIHIILKNR